MESLGRPPTLLSDLLGAISLVLEVGHLGVPVINFIWNYIKGHDPLHEQRGDSSGKEANQDIVVCDASAGGVTLECQNVTFERRGELPTFLDHVLGREPGDGVPSSVLVFKGLLELLEEVVTGSEGNGGAINGVLCHIHKIASSATPDLCSHIHQLRSTFAQVAVRTLDRKSVV